MTSTTTTSQQFDQLLKQWKKSDFGAYVQELRTTLDKYHEEQQRFASPEELRLRIGIMGQVKAGKSTFLNTLLFDGKPILPQAATPKTANLTRISYGEHWQLIVNYYTPKDWDELRSRAHRAAAKKSASPFAALAKIAEAAKSVAQKTAEKITGSHSQVASELLEQAKHNGLTGEDIDLRLAQGTETINCRNQNELMARMNDYVGNNGRYTPLVQMTHLLMPLPELQGFDVVDTPGMNDPVQSRTAKTKAFMLDCDVVFFLSRTSGFLDETDMELLAQQIPSGVRRIVLVGAQLDSTVLDAGGDHDSLQQTLQSIRTALSERAVQQIKPAVQMYERKGEDDFKRAQTLRSMMTPPQPILSSTFAHGFAERAPESWDNAMQHAHKEINAMARQYWGQQELSRQQWLDIAGFAPLREAYETEKQRKQQTLEEKKRNLDADTRQRLHEQLTQWHAYVAEKAKTLRDNDLTSLQSAQEHMQGQLHTISSTLGSVIAEALDNARRQADSLREFLSTEAQRDTELRTRHKTETLQKSYTISTTRWYKPWTWFDDDKTVWTTYDRNYEYFATADAIESAQKYERRCAHKIEREFGALLNPQSLIRRLRNALQERLGNTSAEGTLLKSALDDALKQLQWPPFEMPHLDVQQSLAHHFCAAQEESSFDFSHTPFFAAQEESSFDFSHTPSRALPAGEAGELRSSGDRQRLQKALEAVRTDMYQSLLASFNTRADTVFAALQAVRDGLQHTLSQSLHARLDAVRSDFANKEKQLASYTALQGELQTMLADVGALLQK